MKTIKQSFKIIPQDKGLEGIYKQVELAGRTCYKSEDKITETSAKEFVDRMIKSGHGAMLEHGTVYLKVPMETDNHSNPVGICKYALNKYSKVNEYLWDYYITANMRILVENNWLDDLKYLCEPTEYHEKRVTVKFTTDQGVMREFTRHRVFSFACESTRYCNYSKDKFNNEITFIEPDWVSDTKEINSEAYNNAYEIFCSAMEEAEGYYMTLIENGFKPQQARNVLPLATKCELVMTGFISDWKHFMSLRTPENAHPQARELANGIKEEFIKLGYINN